MDRHQQRQRDRAQRTFAIGRKEVTLQNFRADGYQLFSGWPPPETLTLLC